MYTFTLTINMGNDAMSDTWDVANALQEVARSIDTGSTSGTIRDINGNRVGTWSFN